jgi:hypothetical protein
MNFEVCFSKYNACESYPPDLLNYKQRLGGIVCTPIMRVNRVWEIVKLSHVTAVIEKVHLKGMRGNEI